MPRLLRTSTFRFALSYLGLFTLSVGAILAAFFHVTTGFIERETGEAIAGDIQSLRERFQSEGLDGLAEAVRQRSAVQHSNAVYLLATADGRRVAGNLLAWPVAAPDAEGWLRFQVAAVGGPAGEPATAVAQSFRLGDAFRLLVGRDSSEIDALKREVIASMGWIFAITVGLGLAGGMAFSRWASHRIEAINRTTRQIMTGDLSGRVPRGGGGDEIDQLAGNLNAMLDEIARLMAGMTQVGENIAHDLRTPLTRLRSTIELALLDASGDPNVPRQALTEALTEADRLLSTFNALLSIASMESAARRANFETVDLAELAGHAADLYEPLAEEKGVALEVEIFGRPRVRGGTQLLAQAVANLLDNAVKYTPEGGRIRLSVRCVGESLAEVMVADNGPGIPEDARDAVLGRFVRLDTARATPGNGLGLSLVDAVARLHGARLALADNHPGLAVSLTLPVEAR